MDGWGCEGSVNWNGEVGGKTSRRSRCSGVSERCRKRDSVDVMAAALPPRIKGGGLLLLSSKAARLVVAEASENASTVPESDPV